jgi:predicted aldo/keto reductase-like oxidoreductase
VEYRNIDGAEVSVIGLGTEHLDGKDAKLVDEVINTALDAGINIMDLFMPGETVRRNIGRALKGKRARVMIQGHIGSVDIDGQYGVSRDLADCKRYFENLLRALSTDYIDFGMLFFMDKESSFEKVVNGPILAYARDLKRRGVIRAIGASSHNPVIARRLVEDGLIDILMFSINPAFDMAPAGINVIDYLDRNLGYEKRLDPVRAALYRLCAQRGIAITAMKTLGAGKLISKEQSPFAAPLTVQQCIHYALTRPAVASALVGCASASEVLDALSYLNQSDEERDFSGIVRQYQGEFEGSCVYCNHCLPCPAGIDIAAVQKYIDIAALDGAIPPDITRQYRDLEKHATDCTACGQCESRCPFSVPVVQRMRDAAQEMKNF